MPARRNPGKARPAFSTRRLVDRFVRTVVGRYKDRPAVLGWDLGAEAGIWVTSMGPVDQAPAARLYCYCLHTVRVIWAAP